MTVKEGIVFIQVPSKSKSKANFNMDNATHRGPYNSAFFIYAVNYLLT